MLLNNNDGDRARRLREAALPHLDALYTVALKAELRSGGG